MPVQVRICQDQFQVSWLSELEVANWREFGHVQCRLNGNFKVLIFVNVVRKGGDGAERMGFNNDVDKLELGLQRVEFVNSPPSHSRRFERSRYRYDAFCCCNVGHRPSLASWWRYDIKSDRYRPTTHTHIPHLHPDPDHLRTRQVVRAS